ncbi:hypothetical protein [Steroidobacter sp.]|uniref:hypothetical protein n=1 Tax=Steroidobacter sp. TaxID=1978227 RepID=UPI001A608678|nr:hypothetical protein [Steroidobacter sp.]MBL8264821.1 caspase family protein [Steroidobacter sp.]
MGATVNLARIALTKSLAMLALPASAATYTFVVAGLGGEPEYEQRFRDYAATITSAAEKAAGSRENVVSLTGDDARAVAVRREIKTLASRMTPNDSVVVVLIGHGSYDGDNYRFNLPGPDLTDTEFARLFDELPARDQLIINATSASGAAIERWQKPRRVVITATKNGGERTATRFAQYWALAVGSDAADTNKDQVVTAAEAYAFATRQVESAFKSETSMATEHARLEGDDAGRFTLARLGTAALVPDNPEVAALLSQRGAIELDLNRVKEQKTSLSENQYYDQLEEVLVRLALLQKEIDQKSAGVGTP